MVVRSPEQDFRKLHSRGFIEDPPSAHEAKDGTRKADEAIPFCLRP